MKKGILVILDGYGEGRSYEYNAVLNAKTPTLHNLKKQSHSILKAHGEAVGLFDSEMGGSEVGHLTIGAGRVGAQLQRKLEMKFYPKNLLRIKF